MWSKPWISLLILLATIGSSLSCSWSEQELLSMSCNELNTFFNHQKERYDRITDLIYEGEKIPHLPAPLPPEILLKESAKQLKTTCLNIAFLISETMAQIEKSDLATFKRTSLPKTLERYHDLSLNLDVNVNLYYQSLTQMQSLIPWSMTLAELKVLGGFLLLGYSATTFLIDTLYSANHNALEDYGRGLIGGIGLCLFYSGLQDIQHVKKLACSFEEALSHADEIWTLTTNTDGVDLRRIYRSCLLF